MKKWVCASDFRMILALSAWTLLFHGIGIGTLEFLRHTEADRTIIAWEMLERGQFLVPTLLYSEILTKPPLYYWIAASWIWLFGNASEGVARLPSLFSSLLFVLFQFYVWRTVTNDRVLSGIAAFALSTSLLFFGLSGQAEIDMLFGFLTASALSSLFFILESPHKVEWRFILLLSFFMCLAFLTKGPPVIFFLVGGGGLYISWKALYFPKELFSKYQLRPVLSLVLVMLLTLSGILLWLIPLGSEVGWDVLGTRLEEEVFLRVLNHSERGRGVFFYISSFFVNALPWSFFLVLSLLHFFFGKSEKGELWTERVSPYLSDPYVRRFFQYSLCVLIAGFIMLSIAQGKSSRYSFPLLPFLINCSIFYSMQCLRPFLFKKIFYILKFIAALALVASLFMMVFLSLEGVPSIKFFSALVPTSLLCIVLLYSKARRVWKHWIIYTALVLLIARANYSLLYIPHRNATRSVQDHAYSIVEELKGQPIYTVELFERWTVYYAKRLDSKAYRLTPTLIDELSKEDRELLILMDMDEEAWRFDQLSIYDSDAVVQKVFPHLTSENFLLKVSSKHLKDLSVFKNFPTTPGTPFYPELKQRKLLGE